MFTVTNPNLIDTAALLIDWPFSYCANESNVKRFLAPHYAENSGLEQMVQLLAGMQREKTELPSAENYWSYAKKMALKGEVQSIVGTDGVERAGTLSNQLAHEFDVSLLESVTSALSRANAAGAGQCSLETLQELAHMVWMSQHIALCILGVLRIESDENSIRMSPFDERIKCNLRRTWFGVAFDKYSRLTDEAMVRSINQDGEIVAKTLLFFTKQWRLTLPLDEQGNPMGAVNRLLDSVLLPATRMLVGVLHRTKQGRSFSRGDARKLGCVHDFDALHTRSKKQLVIDRIFDLRVDGVRLGEVQLNLGLLDAAEYLVRLKYGKDWHAEMGVEQARYIATRLGNVNGLKIIEKELRQEVTSEGVPVDVDLFIIDEKIGRVYAIQSKHLEHSFRIGLSDWIGRFRRPRDDSRKGLDLAVGQLENLRDLCATDPKVRDHLINVIGIPEDLIDSIRPVVVHNIGNIDFWKTDTGITLYDLHTFCNVLRGREGTTVKISSNYMELQDVVADEENPRLDMSDPDSVVNAYISDQRNAWAPISNFAIAESVTRSILYSERCIYAVGVGI